MTRVNGLENRAYLQCLTSDKEPILNYHHQALRFRVSRELFSSYQVDAGSKLLLKTLRDLAVADQVRKVLDLGCGYGPLGLALAKVQPHKEGQRQAHLVDRDALAVAFSGANARLNEITNVSIYGSLGYDSVTDSDFDLVVSNIPGKVGHEIIAGFLFDVRRILRPEGIVAIVVVSPLAVPVAAILNRPDVQVLLHEEGSEHVVFHYRFLERKNLRGLHSDMMTRSYYQTAQVFADSAFARGDYDRGQMDITYRGLKLNLQTFRGLPEFDNLSHQTELILSMLPKLQRTGTAVKHALVFNPGQGHVPLGLWKQLTPGRMTLAARDLLALRASARNLAAGGCSMEQIHLSHSMGLAGNDSDTADLILGVLRDSEGPCAHQELLRQAAHLLSPQGRLIVAGASTTIKRLESAIKQDKLLTIKQRKRSRAKRLLVLQHREA